MSTLPTITSIYFDPTTDFGFKKLFSEEANKDLLIDFLNGMLPDYHQIASLNFQKTEQLPNHEEERKAIFDSTFPIQSQAVKGKWDFALSQVYLIGILDFDYDKNESYWKKRQVLRSFNIKDDKGVLMTDKLHFKFLQLPFFKKKPHQLTTHFDKWCYFLKNLENFNSIPNILNEPIFMKAFDVAKVSNLDPNDYILYQISKSKKYDMELVEEAAEKRGIEIGKTEVILTLFSKGYTVTQLSNMLNMPLQKVEEIIKNNG